VHPWLPKESDNDLKTKSSEGAQARKIYYALEIEDWSWTFSFGANDPGDIDGPYWDYRHLHIRCKLVSPKLKQTNRIELHLLPFHDLDESPERGKQEPTKVGTLELIKGNFTGSLFIPFDVLAAALQMMASNHWRFIVLASDSFQSGRASVRSYQLQRTLDEDDLPLAPS
jgi:hypothetical protein